MNPAEPTSVQWEAINTGIIFFWTFVVSMIVFAATFLLAHGMIPSLVSTRQLPPRALSARPVFYILALLALIAAGLSFANIVLHLDVLFDLYGKVWI